MESKLSEQTIDNIKKELVNNDIIPTEEIFDNFEKYYKLLIEYNSKVNLTAITEINEVYIKHFLDSIIYSKIYKQGSTLCDIGTGAGFPGVVLKIIRPDLKITLVDSLNKRVDFLKILINSLGLTNIVALHNRAEDVEFKEQYFNSFDYVVARAVAQMPTLTEYCLPFVKTGGKFVAYKGNNYDNELELSKKCIKLLGGKLNDVLTKNIGEIFRVIIIIDKITKSPLKYPRNQNKPRTKPIIDNN